MAVICCFILGLLVIVAHYGEFPSVGGGGYWVCDVKVTVSYQWTSIPLLPDSVEIKNVYAYGCNWRKVFLSWSPTYTEKRLLDIFDTDNAKLKWTLRDLGGSVVKAGELTGLTLVEHGQWTFIIQKVKPGTYNLEIIVYQWSEVPLIGGNWEQKDSQTKTLTLTAPST